MAKRRLPPDPRASWRDPAMPVARHYKMKDGEIRTSIDPDYERRYREFLMQSTPHPTWRQDPTYNLRKPR